jgi:AcrR family transcriptional regulator
MKQANHSEKGLSTRDKILRAARNTLIEKGYEGLVLRELADTLGIKLGNLQYYFKTKDLLVLAVFAEEARDDLLALTGEITELLPRFEKMVERLVSRWRGNSGVLFSMLGTLALHHSEFKKLHRDNYANFYLALNPIVAELNPTLSESQRSLKVRLITALIDGSSMQVQIGSWQDYLAAIQAQAIAIATSDA